MKGVRLVEDKYKALIACFGMACATVIELFNLAYVGLDGTIASAFIGVIASIVGIAIGKMGKGESE